MKMGLGVIAGVLLGILILAAGGALLANYVMNQVSQASSQPNQPATSPLINLPTPTSLQPTTTAPNATKPTVTSTSSSSSNTPATPTLTATGTDKVNFNVQITNFAGTGLSRTVTADITNTGSQDAHNVVGKIEILNGGKPIAITGSGQTSISQALGTIKAGQAITTQLDLTFTLFDGLTLSQNGATVNMVITSDEKTQTINYDYKP